MSRDVQGIKTKCVSTYLEQVLLQFVHIFFEPYLLEAENSRFSLGTKVGPSRVTGPCVLCSTLCWRPSLINTILIKSAVIGGQFSTEFWTEPVQAPESVWWENSHSEAPAAGSVLLGCYSSYQRGGRVTNLLTISHWNMFPETFEARHKQETLIDSLRKVLQKTRLLAADLEPDASARSSSKSWFTVALKWIWL